MWGEWTETPPRETRSRELRSPWYYWLWGAFWGGLALGIVNFFAGAQAQNLADAAEWVRRGCGQ